jgi:putative DNA primase/helicase
MSDIGTVEETVYRKVGKKKEKSKPEPRGGWEADLQLSDAGEVRKLLPNVITILASHPEWSGVLVYDEFAGETITTRVPPTRSTDTPSHQTTGPWTDVDSVRTAAWVTSRYGFDCSVALVDSAVEAVSRRRTVHPVREYLTGLTWYGVERLPTMLVQYFGADDNLYTRSIGEMWMIGAVARMMRPGCKFDTMLVLEGPQGRLKSTALSVLGGAWFTDTGLVLGDKDSYQAMRNVWIFEIPEFAAIINARDIERVKGFLTSCCDHYRPSYARRVIDVPRHCAFAGSVNPNGPGYLHDQTGARRFWPFSCGTIQIADLRKDRDQLWAEAVLKFTAGQKWWVENEELQEACKEQQAERTYQDDWVPIVRNWLGGEYAKSLVGRPSFSRTGILVRPFDGAGIGTADVLRSAIGLPTEKFDKATQMRAGRALSACGYERKRVSLQENVREWRYFPCPTYREVGQQVGHEKLNDITEVSHCPTCHTLSTCIHEGKCVNVLNLELKENDDLGGPVGQDIGPDKCEKCEKCEKCGMVFEWCFCSR